MKLIRILQLPADLWKAFREQVLHLPGPRAGPTNPTLVELMAEQARKDLAEGRTRPMFDDKGNWIESEEEKKK